MGPETPKHHQGSAPLAAIAVAFAALLVLAALLLGVVIAAPLAVMAAFYVGFAASDRSG